MLWDEERRRKGDCMQQGRRGKEVLYSASEVYAAEVFWQFMWRASGSRSLCLQRCHGRLRCRTQFGRASTKRHCAALTVLLLLDPIVCSYPPLLLQVSSFQSFLVFSFSFLSLCDSLQAKHTTKHRKWFCWICKFDLQWICFLTLKSSNAEKFPDSICRLEQA